MADESRTSIDTADVLAIGAAVARSTGSEGFGVTREGFVPKPFARLLAEKLALARALFGEDLDLGSGSAVRKLLEVSALEDSRTWAALGSMYDNSFVVSAEGNALSALGDELGHPRPYLEARGSVTLELDTDLPADQAIVTVPRGARLLTPGGHHAATEETVTLTAEDLERQVSVAAFYPGAEGNIDPAQPAQKIDRWNPLDASLTLFFAQQAAAASLGKKLEVKIDHTQALTGGELQWPDARYRNLLLRAPRSIWTADAIEIAVSLVPGVRQVLVRDAWGGLDIHQSIFGNFNFVERLFGSERDLGSPYYLTVLVAPTPAAIWGGPDGLRAAIAGAIEDLRPISIFPLIEEADEVGIGIAADLVVKGIALPTGAVDAVNASPAARALKRRLLQRVERYVDSLGFGEPVRASEVMWALMNEPGVADVRELRLLRYPPGFEGADLASAQAQPAADELPCGGNVDFQVNQIPRFVDSDARLTIV